MIDENSSIHPEHRGRRRRRPRGGWGNSRGGSEAYGRWRGGSGDRNGHVSISKSPEDVGPSKPTSVSGANQPNEERSQKPRQLRDTPGSTVFGAHAISITRVASISRSPDSELMREPAQIQKRADELCVQVQNMEANGQTAIENPDAPVAVWDSILNSFRVLTMTLTASGADRNESLRTLAISVYQAAASAALLAGNLSMYLPWQSRLLNDLYPQEQSAVQWKSPRSLKRVCAEADISIISDRGGMVSRNEHACPSENNHLCPRKYEFVGYSLLYFGVFLRDSLQTICILRKLSAAQLASPAVEYAVQAVRLVNKSDYFAFCSHYQSGTAYQRTIMYPALLQMRERAMRVISRAYNEIDADVVAEWLVLENREAVWKLFAQERSDLLAVNPFAGAARLLFSRRRKVLPQKETMQ